jgi:prepilin-type N-terminal cleavage/methylation domain-containing protein
MLRLNMKARTRGFTLVELMFTILVVAILLGIGAPNLRDFIRNSRLTGQANDLLTGLNVARSEAVKRRTPVTLCVGDPTACDADGNFADGWIVFVDVDGDGTVETADGDTVLRTQAAMPDGVETQVVETSDAEDVNSPDYDDSDTTYVSFGQTGFRRMNDGTLPVALAIVLCDERGNVQTSGGPDTSAGRALELSTSGRAAVSRSKTRITALGDCP